MLRLTTGFSALVQKKHAANDSGRTPALIMGGWPPDTLAADVLDKANAMARDLKLEINMKDAFVPGVRRGFALIPLKPNHDETEEEMRQRAQACIRRVSLAEVNLGTKPDGNRAKLLARSEPASGKTPQGRLSRKVKRLIIEAGGPATVRLIEPEWATGTVSLLPLPHLQVHLQQGAAGLTL